MELNARQKRSKRLFEARQKATHTQEQWERMLKFHHYCVLCKRGTCPRCKRTDVKLTKDHIVPIYQGGDNGINNIQPLCSRCNAQKGPEDVDHRAVGWKEYVCIGE